MKIGILIISANHLEHDFYLYATDSLKEEIVQTSSYITFVLSFMDLSGFFNKMFLIENRDMMYRYKEVEVTDAMLVVFKKINSLPDAEREKLISQF